MKKFYSTSSHAYRTSLSVVTGATPRYLTVFRSYHLPCCLSTFQSIHDTLIHIRSHFRKPFILKLCNYDLHNKVISFINLQFLQVCGHFPGRITKSVLNVLASRFIDSFQWPLQAFNTSTDQSALPGLFKAKETEKHSQKMRSCKVSIRCLFLFWRVSFGGGTQMLSYIQPFSQTAYLENDSICKALKQRNRLLRGDATPGPAQAPQ